MPDGSDFPSQVVVHPSADQVIRLYPFDGAFAGIRAGSIKDVLNGNTVRMPMDVLRADVPPESPMRRNFTPKAQMQMNGQLALA